MLINVDGASFREFTGIPNGIFRMGKQPTLLYINRIALYLSIYYFVTAFENCQI